MKELIFSTGNNWVGLIARLTIGIVLFPHGSGKMLAWFGGPGFKKTMELFTTKMQLPKVIAFLVIFVEFFGAVGILIGLGSGFWAIAIIILFLGMIFTSHLQNGFFMNWRGVQAGEGFEYHILMIGLALILFINGSGKISIDNFIMAK